MSEKTNEPKAPTEKELKAKRAELIRFYEQETPLLEAQAKYEQLLTQIDVSKMQRLEIMMAKAQIMQGPQDQAGPANPDMQPEPKEHIRPENTEGRKLKEKV